MSGIAELVERMLKEEYVCYSPILGVGEIKVKGFAFGFYNTENALFLTAEEFGRKPYRVVGIEGDYTDILCFDCDDVDVEYQMLVLKFEASLKDKEQK